MAEPPDPVLGLDRGDRRRARPACSSTSTSSTTTTRSPSPARSRRSSDSGVAGLPLVRALAARAARWPVPRSPGSPRWRSRVPYWTRIFDPTADPEGVLPLAAQIERETSAGSARWRSSIETGRRRSSTTPTAGAGWSNGHEPAPWISQPCARRVMPSTRARGMPTACVRLGAVALGVPVPGATFGPVTSRTGLLDRAHDPTTRRSGPRRARRRRPCRPAAEPRLRPGGPARRDLRHEPGDAGADRRRRDAVHGERRGRAAPRDPADRPPGVRQRRRHDRPDEPARSSSSGRPSTSSSGRR